MKKSKNYKEEKEKTYTTEEVASEIKKAVYKSVLKAIKHPKKETAEKVISDIVDQNYDAEVDPALIPHEKESVVNKNKKGLDKLKEFKMKKIQKKKGKKDRCWEGYEPTPGKKAYSEGSCRKK